MDQFHKYSNVPTAIKNTRGEIINRLSLEIRRGLYCLNWNQKKIEVFSCPKWERFQNQFCASKIKIFTFDMRMTEITSEFSNKYSFKKISTHGCLHDVCLK